MESALLANHLHILPDLKAASFDANRVAAAAPEIISALQNLVEFCEMVFVKPNECEDLIAARNALRKAGAL